VVPTVDTTKTSKNWNITIASTSCIKTDAQPKAFDKERATKKYQEFCKKRAIQEKEFNQERAKKCKEKQEKTRKKQFYRDRFDCCRKASKREGKKNFEKQPLEKEKKQTKKSMLNSNQSHRSLGKKATKVDPFSTESIQAHVDARFALAQERNESKQRLDWIKNILPIVLNNYRNDQPGRKISS
jgi:hypothetical protein